MAASNVSGECVSICCNVGVKGILFGISQVLSFMSGTLSSGFLILTLQRKQFFSVSTGNSSLLLGFVDIVMEEINWFV